MLLRLSKWAIDTEFGGGRQKTISPTFDTHEHLGPWLESALSSKAAPPVGRLLGLQVVGHGGGQWHIVWNDGKIIGADLGLSDRCSAVYQLNVDTFASLAHGNLTAAQAMATGEVVILGNGLSKPELTGVLQQVALKAG